MMDSETEDNQTRIATAKTSFVQAVSEGIDALMNHCGYSRERATNTLVRELSRGESPSTRPNDQEIFDLMSRCGLGIEEATRLVIVGRALQRAMQSAGSPSKAIQNLASKIAVTRLLYDSSEEETTSEDDMPIRPDFRFEPISPMERRTTRSTTRHYHARLSSRTNSTTTPKKSRKRSVEEIVSSSLTEKQKDGPLMLSQQQHPRSESVSEEVSAKIAQQHHDQDVSMPTERKATPAVVRAKRAATHRDDNNSDGGLLNPTNKRQQRGPPGTTADAGL